jgi:predicted TIM-barrel fold metal-dependent hydrolase
MYTALGYRPDDPKLPHLKDFYSRCEREDIPVTCHCSPGGMTAHDFKLYYGKEKKGVQASDSEKEQYFYDEFISPFAWRRVLEKHPKLRLCLAHFCGETFWGRKGGKYWAGDALSRAEKDNWVACLLEIIGSGQYPNVYVDLSYFIFDDYVRMQFTEALVYDSDRIKERLMFGTDWYMIAREGSYGSSMPLPFIKSNGYRKFFTDMYKHVLEINGADVLHKLRLKAPCELLGYFMVLNPVRFLRLRKVAPEMERIHSMIMPLTGSRTFRLKQWLAMVPENIEKMYQ